jgi:hypothetical protein
MCVDQKELRTALEDVDYYRTEAERLRERDRDRDTQLRRKTNDEMRRRQPSNRLYNGDVTDFSDAVSCHISACEQEMQTPRPDDDDDMRRTIERCNTTMRESISRAKQAHAIYDQITAETKTRISDALTNAGLTDWAECLNSGDYSSMAI